MCDCNSCSRGQLINHNLAAILQGRLQNEHRVLLVVSYRKFLRLHNLTTKSHLRLPVYNIVNVNFTDLCNAHPVLDSIIVKNQGPNIRY